MQKKFPRPSRIGGGVGVKTIMGDMEIKKIKLTVIRLPETTVQGNASRSQRFDLAAVERQARLVGVENLIEHTRLSVQGDADFAFVRFGFFLSHIGILTNSGVVAELTGLEFV